MYQKYLYQANYTCKNTLLQGCKAYSLALQIKAVSSLWFAYFDVYIPHGLSQDFENACPKQQFQNFCPS